MFTEVETTDVRYRIYDDGIEEAIYKQVQVDLPVAKRIVEERNVNLPMPDLYVLIRNPLGATFTKSAITYLSRDPKATRGISAAAILSNNWVEKLMMQSVGKIKKPMVKTQFFQSIEKAKAWLREQRAPVAPATPAPPRSSARGARLSPRETEVLRFVLQRKTSRQIADLLDIRERTVETHRHNINIKLGSHDIFELAAIAIEQGYIRKEDVPWMR